MDGSKLIEDVAALVASNHELESAQKGLINSEKFYNAALTTDAVASLHSVTPALVRKYVREGLIETHPFSSPAKILIRASDALLLDFKALKYQLK